MVAKVRIQPQPGKYTITGYLVYAWEGHPLLGRITGTQRLFKSEKEAKRYASGLRKLIKGGKGKWQEQSISKAMRMQKG